MTAYRIELRRTIYEIHEVEADNKKHALEVLNEREDTLFSEEEEGCETMSVVAVEPPQAAADEVNTDG